MQVINQMRNPAEIKELPGNPRTITKAQFEKLKTSIQNNADYFEARPIILSDRTGELVAIAGNQRLKAARALGLKEVPTALIPNLTEEREREIIIRDNVENGDWDFDALANAWDADLLEEWGVEVPGISTSIEIIEDDAPDVKTDEPAKTKLGEIYQLGQHRLMVGDSTDAAQVAALMGGQMADLLITDPPYNVALGSNNGHAIIPSEAKQLHRRTDGKIIENDSWHSPEEFQDFLARAYRTADASMRDGAAFYIWFASTQTDNFLAASAKAGQIIRQTLIWVKNTFALGRQDYQWSHEPCLYGWKTGAAHYFVDIRNIATTFDDEKDPSEMTKHELEALVENYRKITPTTIIRENKPSRSEEHPTMKPVKLIAKLIGNSSKEGDLVLDIFGGSGTTMIAAEQLNRRCYMMELDPHYADVIIERWEKLTGQKAERTA